MIPITHLSIPAAIYFVAEHRAPEAAEARTPEAQRRLADAAHAARLARLEAALRGAVDAPVVLPSERLPPGHLLAAEAAMAEAIESVTRDLRRALEAGGLRAMGFRADGMPVPIPPPYWRAPVRWCGGGAPVMADPFDRAAKGDLVPMGGAFVEPGLECGDVARWCGALPPEPSPPIYSIDALRAWYRLRAATWPPGDHIAD